MLIIVSALVPAIFIGVLFYLLYKNKEPVRILIRAFLLGMASVLLTLAGLTFAAIPQVPHDGAFGHSVYRSFLVAGALEESAKLIVFTGVYFRKEFDEWYDGMLYGVMIGLGFAFVENMGYFTFYREGARIDLILGRSFLSMPMHALLGGVMGYFVGKAKFSIQKRLVLPLILLAWVLSVIMHGLFDFVLMFKRIDLSWLAIPIVIFMWLRVIHLKKVAQRLTI